MTKTNN